MTRWDLQACEGAGEKLVRLAEEGGLVVKEMSLKSLPPNLHWHFSKPGSKGTLEATLILGTGEIWLSVHDNRRADWVEEAVRRILDGWG